MSLRIDRIDFTEKAHCELCAVRPHPLTRGMAYIAYDEHGIEYVVGPSCARRKCVNGTAHPPDFTRGSIEVPEDEEGNGLASGRAGLAFGGSGSARAARVRQSEHDRAVEYVRLRAEKLRHIRQVVHASMDGIYAEWQASPRRQLSAHSVQRVLRNMDAMAQHKPYLAMAHLQTVYAFDFWLGRFLAIEKSDYIASIQRQLRSSMRLTEMQILAANRVFARYLDLTRLRPPRLDPQAFANAWTQQAEKNRPPDQPGRGQLR